MTNEISEEAKKALADVCRRKAIDRLQRDGCCSMNAVQRRVLALAAERNIPPAEYAKLMYKRVSTSHAMAFAEKHKISLDWLLCGDLKGRLRMAAIAPPVLDPWYEAGLLLKKLGDQKLLPAAVECMRLILERRGTAS